MSEDKTQVQIPVSGGLGKEGQEGATSTGLPEGLTPSYPRPSDISSEVRDHLAPSPTIDFSGIKGTGASDSMPTVSEVTGNGIITPPPGLDGDAEAQRDSKASPQDSIRGRAILFLRQRRRAQRAGKFV